MTRMGEHDQPLRDQVAFVTGGGRGLGRVMARALAVSGARVAVAARSEGQLQETIAEIDALGGKAIAVPLDVTDQAAVEHGIDTVQQRWGPIDLLVNNAGVGGTIGPISEANADAWWRTLEVNLFGVFLCSRAVLPDMVRRRQGRIVNVASAAGTRPWPLLSAYAISKAAVLHFTENLGKETRSLGVFCFAIHPGIVRLGMVEQALCAEAPPESPEGLVAAWFRRQLALGRDVSPELGANLVVALASGGADALSGRFIGVGDNLNELIARADEIQHDDLHTLRLRLAPSP